MRLDINLASHPYEDAPSFYKRAFIALGIVVVLTAGLMFYAIRGTRNTRQISRQLDAVNHEISDLDQREAESRAILERPENRGTREQSQFVNSLLAQRAFSWTQVFADLEKIMPTRVHVVSISPALTKTNDLAIKLTVAGDSREKALELVHKLELSRHFRDPRVLNEIAKQAGQGNSDTIEFQLTALYIPDLPSGESSAGAQMARR